MQNAKLSDKLQSDGLHDALQSSLHRIVVRKLGGRIAVAVAVVDSLIMRQNTEQLQTVLLNLGLDAVVENTAGARFTIRPI